MFSNLYSWFCLLHNPALARPPYELALLARAEIDLTSRLLGRLGLLNFSGLTSPLIKLAHLLVAWLVGLLVLIGRLFALPCSTLLGLIVSWALLPPIFMGDLTGAPHIN